MVLGGGDGGCAATPPQELQIAPGVTASPLWLDEGREVYKVTYYNGPQLAIKHWDASRLAESGEQVFNELRARMSSSLHSCTYVVLPLHISTSREGGALVVYPFAGTSMDTVCSQLRGAGQREELVRLLAHMSTSVLLTLQKLQAHKPKPLVHRDVKLSNLLLGADGLVRLADFGSLSEAGSPSTSHDPSFFPPDLAALLHDGTGRHVFEEPAALCAANSLLLDLRGLGMALIQGYAGCLPADVALGGGGGDSGGEELCTAVMSRGLASTACGDMPTAQSATIRSSSSSGSSDSSTTTTNSPPPQHHHQQQQQPVFDGEEQARLLRIAHHDWAASIDALIPAAEAPTLNAFAKLLVGPDVEPTPGCLARLLQQPLIKPVHRPVLDTARKARKHWAAHVAACRAAVAQVVGPLLQLEQQQLPAYGSSSSLCSLCSLPPLSEQFEVLAEQFADGKQQQQEEVQEQEEQQQAGSTSTDSDVVLAPVSAPTPAAAATAGGGLSTAATTAKLQAALGGVLSQLAVARPDAAARIQVMHQELLLLLAAAASGTPPPPAVHEQHKQQLQQQQQVQQAVGGWDSASSAVLPAPVCTPVVATGQAAADVLPLLQAPVTPPGSVVSAAQQDGGGGYRSHAGSSSLFSGGGGGGGGSDTALSTLTQGGVADVALGGGAGWAALPTGQHPAYSSGGDRAPACQVSSGVSHAGGGGGNGAATADCWGYGVVEQQQSDSWGLFDSGPVKPAAAAAQHKLQHLQLPPSHNNSIWGLVDEPSALSCSPLAGCQADLCVEVVDSGGGGGGVGGAAGSARWGPAGSCAADSVCSEKSVLVHVEVLVVDSATTPSTTKPAAVSNAKKSAGHFGCLWGAGSDMLKVLFPTG